MLLTQLLIYAHAYIHMYVYLSTKTQIQTCTYVRACKQLHSHVRTWHRTVSPWNRSRTTKEACTETRWQESEHHPQHSEAKMKERNDSTNAD